MGEPMVKVTRGWHGEIWRPPWKPPGGAEEASESAVNGAAECEPFAVLSQTCTYCVRHRKYVERFILNDPVLKSRLAVEAK